ncbi:MAG: fructose-bisphosphate aldolase [Nanoarchaeota archaeon]|nr:fructose-bisphosphate aldolase [Nanoarchaeota archaeon]
MAFIIVDKILRNKRAMILSYDFGIEHGPATMNDKNIDPKYVLDIALESDFTGIILTPGLAQKYYNSAYTDVPLIIKLNSKTSIPDHYPISKQTCSVRRAIKLGASAVAYTIYDGSPNEPVEFREFGRIVEEAHDYGIPVIAYMYPRGPTVKNELDPDILAYSARIGLELGADFLKMKYNNSIDSYKWIVKCAGRANVLITSDFKSSNQYMLSKTQDILKTGATGVVFGPHIWKNEKPFSLAKSLRAIIFDNKTPEQASEYLK